MKNTAKKIFLFLTVLAAISIPSSASTGISTKIDSLFFDFAAFRMNLALCPTPQKALEEIDKKQEQTFKEAGGGKEYNQNDNENS